MTDKIFSLTGAPLPGDPVPQVVDMLRDLVARAERGEIVAMAYAGIGGNADVFAGWEGAHAAALGGAISGLQSIYMTRMMSGDME